MQFPIYVSLYVIGNTKHGEGLGQQNQTFVLALVELVVYCIIFMEILYFVRLYDRYAFLVAMIY